jgi:4-carboxymuconolactone decarboxylase
MRLRKPRLEPMELKDMDEDSLRGLGDGPVFNIFRTIGHHPKLLKRWMVFANHILAKNTLSPRDRELAILRVGWLCRAEYEWAQHTMIALRSGISEEEVERVSHGPDADGWTEKETAVLRAADELVAGAFIENDTWKQLEGFYNKEQLLDLVFTIGQYNLVSMALNTLGVQVDEGIPRSPGFPTS